MTEKQRLFCIEYLIDLNATRAYLEVYENVKKESVAAAAASRLLKNVKIKKIIEEELEKIKSEKIADATEILEHLTAVMRGEVTEERAMVVGLGDYESKIDTIEIQATPKDRNKAAELLAKRYGLLTDNINVNQVPVIEINVPDEQ